MNIGFLYQFKYWNEQDGHNYTLDAHKKTLRYIHDVNPNIVAEIEYLKFENKDDKYVGVILNTETNTIYEKTRMISDKEMAFKKLAECMHEWDKVDV